MRRIRVTDPRARELIEVVTEGGPGTPVRALEAVLARGDEGLGMLLVGLRNSVDSPVPFRAQWCGVGLGVLGDPAAAPELTMLLRVASRGRWIGLGFSAAEALGRMGEPAERALLENARLTLPHERYWFHYAAARMATDGATAFLLNELEKNLPLADSAALALAELRCADALPAIGRRLKRLKPWQLALIEPAVIALHRGDLVVGRFTEDWRLRYRYSPGFDWFPPLLPCLTAMIRSSRPGRAIYADTAPARSIDEILARATPPDPAAAWCRACGAETTHHRTGVFACEACAPAVAHEQSECLLGVECTSNDLFDVLNEIDVCLEHHDHSGFPPDDRYRRYKLAHEACYWLVGQGIETTAAGAAALLVESGT